MNRQDSYSFGFDSTQSRYFLIPVNYELIEGEFILQMLDGTERKVDFSELDSFEVTEAVAAAYLGAKASDVLDQIGDASTNLLDSVSQPASVPAQRLKGTQSTISSVAALLGITPAVLQQDSTSTQAGLRELLSHIKAELSQITIDGARASEASRSQLNALQETLQSRGVDISKALENLPATLRELITSADDELVLAEVAAVLPDLLQQIERSPTNVGELLNQTMQTVLQKLDQPISDEEKAQMQEKQQRAYERSAQEAIASVLEVPPVPSLESLMQQLGYLDQDV
jgi:hypothetical protein